MSVTSEGRRGSRTPITGSGPGTSRRKGRDLSPVRESVSVKWLRWISLTLISLFGLLPIYWLVTTALKPDADAFSFPPKFIPTSITFDHFSAVLGNHDLLRYMGNSLLVSSVTAIGSVLIGMYCAYSFSKFEYRGRRSIMLTFLASQLFPHVLLLITMYALFSVLGILNTYLVLVLAFTTFTLPLCIWMIKGVFDNIPNEIIEAAKIDGAGQGVIIHRILLPLMRPGLIAAGMFAFIRGWNDFVFALTLSGDSTRTLPPGLVNTYLSESANRWPELMAASLIASLPVVLIFLVLQRHFVAGLSSGAVKG